MTEPMAPPQNLEAEREMLGALLAYYTPELLATVQTAVRAEDFYRRTHQIIFRAIVAVAAKGDHVDIRTVARFLQCHRQADEQTFLEAAGGEATLELLVCCAVPYGAEERARIVAEDGEWRRRLNAAYEQIEACHARDETAWRSAAGEDVPRLRVIPGGEAAAS